MNRRIAARVTGAVVLAAGTTVGLTLPATADQEAPAPVSADQEVLLAMQRDLGLDAAEAELRLAQEAAAATAEETLTRTLDGVFAGAVFDAERGALVVAVTDEAEASAVRAAGAVPRVVEHTLVELESVKSAIDQTATSQGAPAGVSSWAVDVETNSVVVTVDPELRDAEVDAFLDRAASDGTVRVVEEANSTPVPFADIVGGDAYYPGASRCSVGFSVDGGFVTAGHCGTVGTSTSGVNQQSQGTVAGSIFPGSDMGWVETNSSWTPTAAVNDYDGGTVAVSGSSEAAIGASVCRSGSTTGWHCGTIEAKGVTVNYQEGAVHEMTQTSACAEPGDSGGSWLSGSQAQGVTSGGSGNCTLGGTTFFQPLNPILSEFGLSLTTS
ncbi:S1 family peptidase [Actinoalloteichus sp. AHMU CJ021]|uniref:S1 family peptidase n=1 Tax=Actinoalloteichus TaxID=65496 RepID=UPI0004AA62CC|nr:S1 family peptidase [Actinoalloteichus caeruleus]AUS78497.1 S1 family peptidase [Actinoalloteichus sp. AHMU CJ021]